MERPFLFIEGTALNAFIFTEIISKIKVILPDAVLVLEHYTQRSNLLLAVFCFNHQIPLIVST